MKQHVSFGGLKANVIRANSTARYWRKMNRHQCDTWTLKVFLAFGQTETFPPACFWIYYVSCACIVETCACQLYIKRKYDDDDGWTQLDRQSTDSHIYGTYMHHLTFNNYQQIMYMRLTPFHVSDTVQHLLLTCQVRVHETSPCTTEAKSSY